MTTAQGSDTGHAIRTPDQRLRVFVSSTLGELADERAAVARAIEALRLTPVLFELGARPHPPRELYRAYLAQSDVFVGLYWQRYGWVGPGMDVSGLEDEFRLSGSMPRLLYVKAPAPDREAGLTAMIEQIQSTGSESYRTFHDADELDRLVRDDLALLLSERFASAVDADEPPPIMRPRLLPVPATSLIGREHDIAQVTELLSSPDVRLVTITGPGGIGKTRLAIAVGRKLEIEFPDGAAFVSLSAVDEADLVLPRVASALGASVEGNRPVLDVIAEHVGDAPTLLVLDNLEQVADVAPVLDELMGRCRRVRILATSRATLRLRAEHEYPVGPLDVPPRADLSAEAVASCSCVQLFVERARAMRYDFALDDESARAVAEICRRLDGLPLAIELAAARTRLLSPSDLLARLETSIDALGTGPVDLPERQRTMRATVEWSIGLLADNERELLGSLTVFVDGWALDAATRIAGRLEDQILDLLDALTGHSLLHVVVTDEGARFRMLGSVREIAAELLAARDDRDDVERRHAQYYRDFVEGLEWPGQQHREWAERLRVEEENVRAAVHWFLEHDVTPLPHLFRSLWLYWQLLDQMTEGRRWIDRLLDRVDSFDPRSRVEVLLTSAMTAVEVGDDRTALATAAAIETQPEPIDDPFLAGSVQLVLAWIRPIEGDDDGSLRAAVRAFDTYLAANELVGASGAAMSAGMASMNLGRPDDARRWFGEVERFGGATGNNWLQDGRLTHLALLAVEEGDLDEARRLVVASVSNGDIASLNTNTLAFALVAYASVAMASARPRDAATALGAAAGLRQRVGVAPWPVVRRNEAALDALVRAALGDIEHDEAFADGAELDQAGAVAMIRQTH